MTASSTTEKIDAVVIRFAGDSGDGMQLAGSQFTLSSAVAGNDLATLPDFPQKFAPQLVRSMGYRASSYRLVLMPR